MEVSLKPGEAMVEGEEHFCAFSISRNFFSKTNFEILLGVKSDSFVKIQALTKNQITGTTRKRFLRHRKIANSVIIWLFASGLFEKRVGDRCCGRWK